MALIKCYKCGKEISSVDPACPSCGAPREQPTTHSTVPEDSITTVKQHLTADMDVNARDDQWGRSPLDCAVVEGDKKVIELLITKGADVNAKDHDGVTPLHAAVQYGHKGIAELLIANGADVNTKTLVGSTPLHAAAFLGYKEIVELLVAK